MTNRRERIWIGAALVAALAWVPSQAMAQPSGTPGTTITVNSLGDGFIVTLPGQPLPCQLRDAIQAANTNKAVGGCPAGVAPHVVSASPLRVDGIDRIVFSVGTGTPRIQLRTGLPAITEAVTIDGATGGATRIEVAGGQIFSLGAVHGFLVTGTYSTFKSLVINGFRGNGIVLSQLDGSGIVIVTPSKPERPEDVSGSLPGDPCGPSAFPSDPSQCPPPGGFPGDDTTTIGSTGGGGHTVIDCLIGTDATGSKAVPNGLGTADSAGVVALTSGNVIGGTVPASRNVIAGNAGHGILLDGRNNKVFGNSIGVGLGGQSLGNQLDGVFVAGGQFAGATCEVRSNTIIANGGDGVDAGYNQCSILSNSISLNGGLGIERAEPGVTANDPARRRPPNTPELVASRFTFPSGTVIAGQLTQVASQPVTVEIFYSPTCDPTGHGEGKSFAASVLVNPGTRVAFLATDRVIRIGGGFYTATATTVDGTSEFSACLPL